MSRMENSPLPSEDMIARLIAQATRDDGAGASDLITLRAIVEEASEAGAARALGRMGLADESAQDDIDELRELLGAWRETKSGALKAALDWIMRGMFALLLIGIAVRLGVPEMVR